jgi:2-methylfumaryl-CoA isomerase
LDFSAGPRVAPRRAPLLGEHTDQVLTDVLGLGSREIARLREQGVIAEPAAVQATPG